MPKVLRPDQERVINETYAHIRAGVPNVLLVMATGAGKTFTAGCQARDAIGAGHKIMFMVNRDALVEQAFDQFRELGIDTGVWAGDHKDKIRLDAPLQVVSAQTLEKRKIPDFVPTMSFLDESHRVAYLEIAQPYLLDRRLPVIGLTATPYRLDANEEMGDKFGAMVTGLLPGEMMEMGLLKTPRYYNLSHKHNRRGAASLAFLLKEWRRLANGRRTCFFPEDVDHAHEIADYFTANNVPVAAIYGKMSTRQRREAFKKAANGELMGLSSCDALSEGFDVPVISCVAICRNIKSKAKLYQQIGRGVRRYEGISDCVVLDTTGVTDEFPRMELITDYYFGTSQGKQFSSREPAKKTCPNCDASLFAFQMTCNKCKHKFPPTEMPDFTIEEELLLKENVPLEKVPTVLRYRRQRQAAYYNNRSLSAVDKAFNLPPKLARGAIFDNSLKDVVSDMQKQAKFVLFLQKQAKEENRDESWVQQEYAKEFARR